jgi:hypothetical protein
MVVTSLLLEKLREMMLAVEDALQGCIVGRWDGTAPMGAFEAGLVVCLFFNWYLQCVFNRHELQPPLATHFGGWWRAIGKDFGESKQAKQGRQIWWIKKNRNKLFFLNELNFTNSGVQALRIDHDIVWYIHWSSWWTN